MKKLILFCAMFVLASCSKSPVEEVSMAVNDYEFYAYAPEAQSDSRTYVDAQKKLHWTKGDLITIFHGLLEPLKFGFRGETGATSGTYYNVDGIFYAPDQSAPNNVAIYPYSADHQLNDSSRAVTLSMPAVQTYAEDSFGLNANTMVAVTSNVNDLALYFKNVGTYLNVRLWGENQTVKSITITATGGEALSGKAKVTPTYGGDPTCVMAINDVSPSVKLVCEEAVTVNTTEDAPVSFWIVLPPVTMEQGFTAMVENAEGQTKVFTIDRSVTFARNKYNTLTRELAIIHNNEIHYTATEQITPSTGFFGATYLPEQSTYDSETQMGVLKFDAEVEHIGERAFNGSSSLTSIKLPDKVQWIASSAFENCTSLTAVTIPEGVRRIGPAAFGYCSSLASVAIPNSVVTIESGAFYGCTSLSSITIPEGITTIEGLVFFGCSTLASITIPEGVTTIGARAFYDCSSLASVYIPASVETIEDFAFERCSLLQSVSIPNRVTAIGEGAFSRCTALSSVIIPACVTKIERSTFSECTSLKSVYIPMSVTSIGEYAFCGCTMLSSVVIPESVLTIGNDALNGCTSLTSLYSKAITPPAIGTDVFYPYLLTVYVPTESVDLYKEAPGWSDYADNIVGYNFL